VEGYGTVDVVDSDGLASSGLMAGSEVFGGFMISAAFGFTIPQESVLLIEKSHSMLKSRTLQYSESFWTSHILNASLLFEGSDVSQRSLEFDHSFPFKRSGVDQLCVSSVLESSGVVVASQVLAKGYCTARAEDSGELAWSGLMTESEHFGGVLISERFGLTSAPESELLIEKSYPMQNSRALKDSVGFCESDGLLSLLWHFSSRFTGSSFSGRTVGWDISGSLAGTYSVMGSGCFEVTNHLKSRPIDFTHGFEASGGVGDAYPRGDETESIRQSTDWMIGLIIGTVLLFVIIIVFVIVLKRRREEVVYLEHEMSFGDEEIVEDDFDSEPSEEEENDRKGNASVRFDSDEWRAQRAAGWAAEMMDLRVEEGISSRVKPL
jgi:hypothetical protein